MGRLSCVLVMAVFAAFAVGAPLQAADIKIGIVDCYSGPPATYSNDVLDGFKMAVEKINAKGGVLGKKITFVTRDDKFKVDIGLSAAKELIMRENVDLLMGTINSAVTLAVSDLCKNEKMPLLVTYAKSSKITGEKGHRYVFSFNENTSMIGKATAAALAKKPYVKYWIAGDDYEYGHSIAEEAWKYLKQAKPDVQEIGKSWWKVGEPDFTPYITSILAAKPDCVLMATGGAGCVPFLKAAKATGFNERVPFFMHTATELSTLRPLGANAPAGVLGSSNYFFYYPDTPANKAFAEEYHKAYKKYPSFGSLIGYVTAYFIADAYKKAGKVDKEKFIDALEGMSVDSPLGKLKMREYDHQLMLPMYVGVSKKDPKYDFLVATDIVTIPPEEAMPSVDEIKKLREGKK
ncbi:MAG: ABC transporter substrate-binding protein [Thermodesulfobacteriota bacterium]